MFTRNFLRDLAERVVATFAEAWAALLLASGMGLIDAPWQTSASVAGMTALVALLKGIAAGYKDADTGASLLSDPPPRVDRGAIDVSTAILIGALVLLVLIVAGAFR